MKLSKNVLPIPAYFADALATNKVEQLYIPDYGARAAEATEWALINNVTPAASQDFDISLLAIDFQIAFAMTMGPLFVGGRSGRGAIEDTERLIRFILQYGHLIKRIIATLDTHRAMAVFHAMFWVYKDGSHPDPSTQITVAMVKSGQIRINPAIVGEMFGGNELYAYRYAMHYVTQLEVRGKQLLIVWPYHVILGGIDHALVPLLHETIFFWEVARSTMRENHVKGGHPLFENYSVVDTEVNTIPDPQDHMKSVQLVQSNTAFMKSLDRADAILVPNQARSHCGASSIEDFGGKMYEQDPTVVQRIYLPTDMASDVVIPPNPAVNFPGLDFTDVGEAAYTKFAGMGMNVQAFSDTPMWEWTGPIQQGWNNS
ncbi:MAG: isochorismatase [Candidatus Pacebacteria bacterium]|nr:isochorismatase [Candidatus Paceibacterota bacterium]